ncbi:MAG: aldehyde dehydrogenase family protein, partial [Proteobacteria bacterium]|nr:aldehyde dehydrogenase family protein [Pseudomonadota bacterium]
MRSIAHYVQGEALSVAGARTQPVFNPSLGVPQATLELGDVEVVARAVESARAAQPAWAAVNPQRRARVMFEFKRLLEAQMDELA